MPGILPMKVIKIGTSAQTRIAQACDRCRSKKIRCDGIRPCCTQCANVGFECKTSDKLSRRAFPRGYTESLEERVRTLEAEVRELKELLDEKDEKLDMLSRIHSHSSQPVHLPSPRRASDSSQEPANDDFHDYDEPDEVFKVKRPPLSPHLAGPSSAQTFIDSFEARARDHGISLKDLPLDQLLPCRDSTSSHNINATSSAPPRLVSDQLINLYFQEWAPLFPVLHRPTFLAMYERYVAATESVCDHVELSHLNLVFSIASLSTGTASEELESMEAHWMVALDQIQEDNTIETLQALVLAQIYCLQKNDATRLSTFKSLATSMSSALGLHQAQPSYSLDPLSFETRKRLFWTLYTIDCFSSVVLGRPKHIQDEDITCDYPVDVDDEYITETGFQPALPGETTRVSSALALFKAARILSRVIDEVYPAKTTYELSLKQLSDLSDELELWEAALPSHLRLHFAQDKPSTGTITSRSPILSLAYHYIRALIHRPAIVSKSLGKKASTALMTHAASCKKIVQILQLLDERSLSFSFCLNRTEVLITSGLGLLLQCMDLDVSSKTSKDNQKTIATIIEQVNHSAASISSDAFRQLVTTILPSIELATTTKTTTSTKTKRNSKPSISRTSSDHVIVSEQHLYAQSRKQLKPITSRFATQTRSHRLSTSSYDGFDARSSGSSQAPLSMSPVLSVTGLSNSPLSDTSLHLSLSHSPPDSAIGKISEDVKQVVSEIRAKKRSNAPSVTNLDYLSFGNEPEQNTKTKEIVQPIKSEPSPTDWERLLGNLDNGATNIFDASYGGPPIETLSDVLDLTSYKRTSAAINDAALAWNAGLLSLQEPKKTNDSPPTDSSLSYSSDGPSDEVSSHDWASSNDSNGHDTLPLVFSEVGDFDIGIDWQEALTSSI